MAARCCTIEVLPVPVSPTSSTGSRSLTHTASCSSSRRLAPVGAKCVTALATARSLCIFLPIFFCFFFLLLLFVLLFLLLLARNLLLQNVLFLSHGLVPAPPRATPMRLLERRAHSRALLKRSPRPYAQLQPRHAMYTLQQCDQRRDWRVR